MWSGVGLLGVVCGVMCSGIEGCGVVCVCVVWSSVELCGAV